MTLRKSISYHFKANQYGAVAQLAERVARIHEARGSNPLSSTNNLGHRGGGSFCLLWKREAQSAGGLSGGKLTERTDRIILRSFNVQSISPRRAISEPYHHPHVTKVFDVLREPIQRKSREASPNGHIGRARSPHP